MLDARKRQSKHSAGSPPEAKSLPVPLSTRDIRAHRGSLDVRLCCQTIHLVRSYLGQQYRHSGSINGFAAVHEQPRTREMLVTERWSIQRVLKVMHAG